LFVCLFVCLFVYLFVCLFLPRFVHSLNVTLFLSDSFRLVRLVLD